MTMPKTLTPIHPGEILREDVLEPLKMSANQFAKAIGVNTPRLNDIVRGRRGITADTALRLARYLGVSAKFWMNLQADYDLRVAQQKVGPQIERQVKTRSDAA
jgi:addiction module HigA family antidote